MIRILRITVVILFLAVSAVFGKVYYEDVFCKDKTLPKITIDKDVIKVKTNAKEKDLLKGVSAFDEKDGDITDKVIVESISKFYEPGVCKVKYAVCDSDSHVATASRKIQYIGYTSPKFSLNRSLLFRLGERINLSSIVEATDVIEGDITKNVIVVSSDYKSGQVGTFHVEMKTSNEKGDIVTLTVPMIVEEIDVSAPNITLKQNLLYKKAGKSINPEDYIESIENEIGETISGATVTIESNVNYKKPGVYTVRYYVTDSKGRVGQAMMNVVLTES